MELHHLRCFVAVADELHFGRAARKLDMLPSALGRFIRLLEEDLGAKLLERTTRNVALTPDGARLLDDARALIAQADLLAARFRAAGRNTARILRIGAIDSAASGLLPLILHDFREWRPGVAVEIVEDKTIRLLPRLASGRIDLAFVRPPPAPDKKFEFRFLFHETAVAAVSTRHPLARRKRLAIADLADQALIVPDRRSRPHSHDLTMKLFAEAGLKARVAQVADEKQTIVNLVAAEIGVAIVPRWTARMAITGVRYVPLAAPKGQTMTRLPLAAAWLRAARDPLRADLLAMLDARLDAYAAQA